MLNRVTVTVDGLAYTLLSDDPEEYVQAVASYVSGKIGEARENGAAALESAVFGALNIADSYFRERDAAISLREQMKGLLEDTVKLRAEVRALKKKINLSQES